jgi:prepilin-type N-terminal cleavage/methylation domain-containing protein
MRASKAETKFVNLINRKAQCGEKKSPTARTRGFTLIEILVAVTVIAIVGTVAVVRW